MDQKAASISPVQYMHGHLDRGWARDETESQTVQIKRDKGGY